MAFLERMEDLEARPRPQLGLQAIENEHGSLVVCKRLFTT